MGADPDRVRGPAGPLRTFFSSGGPFHRFRNGPARGPARKCSRRAAVAPIVLNAIKQNDAALKFFKGHQIREISFAALWKICWKTTTRVSKFVELIRTLLQSQTRLEKGRHQANDKHRSVLKAFADNEIDDKIKKKASQKRQHSPTNQITAKCRVLAKLQSTTTKWLFRYVYWTQNNWITYVSSYFVTRAINSKLNTAI